MKKIDKELALGMLRYDLTQQLAWHDNSLTIHVVSIQVEFGPNTITSSQWCWLHGAQGERVPHFYNGLARGHRE